MHNPGGIEREDGVEVAGSLDGEERSRDADSAGDGEERSEAKSDRDMDVLRPERDPASSKTMIRHNLGSKGGATSSKEPEKRARPDQDGPHEAVIEPAKVMRIGSMARQLLEEARQLPLDEAARFRLKDIYETSVQELSGGLSADLAAELAELALPFEQSVPSESELRVAQAQLVGWLEGLFHGVQATLLAQQMAARGQLEQMRGELPSPPGDGSVHRPGTYL